MDRTTGRLTGAILLIGVLVLALVGCSNNAPSQSTSTDTDLTPFVTAQNPAPPDTRVQFVATIATIDYDSQMLTFVEEEATVYADEECEVVEVVAGVENYIEFADLVAGDRVKICGITQEDGTVLANKICLYSGEEFCQYDLAFRDTIATIDYDNGTFTVYNRDEVITVDGATIIWGIETSWQQEGTTTDPDKTASATSQFNEDPKREHEVPYTFDELKPGFVVEVKANIVDESMLYATNIKLANSSLRVCVVFDTQLASIDLDLQTVTFSDNDWIGYVCKGALLLDADGLPILLEDFQVDDMVSVKGFPVIDGGDSLRVCEMTKLE